MMNLSALHSLRVHMPLRVLKFDKLDIDELRTCIKPAISNVAHWLGSC